MAKSNRRIRERRLARRLGTTAASAEASASSGRPLVRHTARCRCAGCQKREDDRIVFVKRKVGHRATEIVYQWRHV